MSYDLFRNRINIARWHLDSAEDILDSLDSVKDIDNKKLGKMVGRLIRLNEDLSSYIRDVREARRL